VVVVVLLKFILHCGNNLYKYLVDLDAMSLVSWIAIMASGLGVFVSD
jgi:hypothetical protein